MVIIDAQNASVGRLASKVAKKLLNGEEVHIINAEKALISGNPRYVEEKYRARRALKNKQDPEKSPKWPRVPSMLLRRIIRGMLPRKKSSGRAAYKRLRVSNGNPSGEKGERLEGIEVKNLRRYITLEELCKKLGWRGS